MPWPRAELLRRLFPDHPPPKSIVLGIAIGDRWSEVAARRRTADSWFELVDEPGAGIRALRRVDGDSRIEVDAGAGRADTDVIDRLHVAIRGAGTEDRETVLAIDEALREHLAAQLGPGEADGVYTLYDLGYAPNPRLRLWLRSWRGAPDASPPTALVEIWTDI